MALDAIASWGEWDAADEARGKAFLASDKDGYISGLRSLERGQPSNPEAADGAARGRGSMKHSLSDASAIVTEEAQAATGALVAA